MSGVTLNPQQMKEIAQQAATLFKEGLAASGLSIVDPNQVPTPANTSPVARAAAVHQSMQEVEKLGVVSFERPDGTYLAENRTYSQQVLRRLGPGEDKQKAMANAELECVVLACALAAQIKRQDCGPVEILERDFTPNFDLSESRLPGMGLKGLANVVRQAQRVAKAVSGVMSGVSMTDGAAWVPVEWLSGYVDVLTAGPSVLLANGIQRFTISSTEATLPKLTSQTSTAYLGPGEQPTLSIPSTGAMHWRLKRLAGGIVVNNRWVTSVMSLDAARILTMRLAMDWMLAQNQQLLRGTPTEYKPHSLRSMCKAGHFVAFSGTTTNIDDVKAWLLKITGAPLDANVPRANFFWIASDKLRRSLVALRASGSAFYPYADELEKRGTIEGWPVIVSNQQPNNLGGGGNETELTLFRAAELYIAEGPVVQIKMSDLAAYTVVDGSGNTVPRSAFMGDETVIYAQGWHDNQLARDEAVAIGTGYVPYA